jgi:hypothetical protein
MELLRGETAMSARLNAIILAACVGMSGSAAAAELAPGSGHSIHLPDFSGVIYYTIEHDGYRVVATLASGPEAPPIRFISMLGPGQRVVISVPGAAGKPSKDFEIVRNGDALLAYAWPYMTPPALLEGN